MNNYYRLFIAFIGLLIGNSMSVAFFDIDAKEMIERSLFQLIALIVAAIWIEK